MSHCFKCGGYDVCACCFDEEEDKLTGEDIRMIEYFIVEKGDITRWSSWEDRKHLIKKELPHLIDAIQRLDMAERTLMAIVKSLDSYDYDYDEE